MTDPAEVAARVVRLVTERLRCAPSTAPTWRSRARSMCLHGDTPGAVDLARAVRDALDEAGVDVQPFAVVTAAAACRTDRGRWLVEHPDPAGLAAVVRDRARRRPDRGRARRDDDAGAWRPTGTDRGRRRGVAGRRGRVRRRGRRARSARADRDPGRLRRRGPDRGRRGHRPRRRRGRRPPHRRRRTAARSAASRPGSATSTGLDPALHLPRRSTPRSRVPAGSVAIAAGYTRRVPDGLARRLAPPRPHRRSSCGDTDRGPAGAGHPRRDRALRRRPGGERPRRRAGRVGRRRSRTSGDPDCAHLGVPGSGAVDPDELAAARTDWSATRSDAAGLETARWARRAGQRPGGRRHVGRAGRHARSATASSSWSSRRRATCSATSPCAAASTCAPVLGSRSHDTLLRARAAAAGGRRRARRSAPIPAAS